MTRKNLKVSEVVHEEITIQKRRDESVDDLLRRKFGILPTSVEELTSYYPDSLSDAADQLVDFFHDPTRYNKIVTDHDDHFALNFDSAESRRTIIQLQFSNGPSHIDLYYRNERGNMKHICTADPMEDCTFLEGGFPDPDTGDRIHIQGEFPGEISHYEDEFKALEDAAYERWG
jgi:hypothetical protein